MNVDAPSATDNLTKFQHRCAAMALLWQLDDIAFSDAVDRLEAVCRELGINDIDTAQQIMAQAFAAVIDE